MYHVQQVIDDYLEAVGQIHGKAYQQKVEVKYTGGTHLIIKRPSDEHPQLLHVGRVEDMTECLRQQVQERPAA